MRYSIRFAMLLSVVAATSVSAQERDVQRRLFTYLDRQVTVEVLADIAGTLRVVRGEPGLIEVAGRAPGGLTSAALGGRAGDNLRLTAAGGEQADFIVVVPEDVYLRIKLPGNQTGDLGSTRPGGTFTWPAGGAAPDAWRNGPSRSASIGPYTNDTQTNGTLLHSAVLVAPAAVPSGPMIAHAAERAPRVLDVSKLNALRSITLRIEPGLFEVGGNRYMSVLPGNPDVVEVRTGDASEDIVIGIPAETRDFTLKLGGQTALVIRGTEITAYCEPVVDQRLSGDRRWFTFAPEAGRVDCAR